MSQFFGIGLKSLGMPFNWKDNSSVLNVLAFLVKVRQKLSMRKHLKARQMCVDDDERKCSLKKPPVLIAQVTQ